MKKYYQLLLIIACILSLGTVLIYRHEYYRLRYVLEVLNFFGKPPENEGCPFGINSTLLTERLDTADEMDIIPYFQRIDDYHIAYSSFWRKEAHGDLDLKSEYYGTSSTIVIGSKKMKQNFRCHFLFQDREKPIIGKFSYSRLESKTSLKENKDYVVFIFNCKMTRPIGQPFAVSFFPNTDSNPLYAPVIKMLDLNRNRSRVKITDENQVSFENTSKITACIIPNKNPLVTRRSIIEFLSFHQMMGITEFHIYDNSVNSRVINRIQLLSTELTGFDIDTLPFNFPFPLDSFYYLLRDIAELDCSLRNLNTNRRLKRNNLNSHERTRHILALSWDEFIVPRYKHSLKALLNNYSMDKKIKKFKVSTLHFCTNQKDDPKSKSYYPNIAKKTHYDKSAIIERPSYIDVIGSMNVKDIEMTTKYALNPDGNQSLARNIENLSPDLIAVHKYIDCLENGYKKSFNNDVDLLDFESRPHQFEGVMLRFAEDMYNNKLYTLYRTKSIWTEDSLY